MEVALTKGYVALVDECDFYRVAAHHWQACVKLRSDGSARVYALGKFKLPNGKQKTHTLHRFIMDAPIGMQVDHIDGNPLNNCRVNLRLCTPTENNRNMIPRTGCSSVYKGVTKHSSSGKWQANIRVNGRLKYLGLFFLELEAAQAYDVAAIAEFGEFAYINVYPAIEAAPVSGK